MDAKLRAKLCSQESDNLNKFRIKWACCALGALILSVSASGPYKQQIPPGFVPGSFIYEPAFGHHYDQARNEEVLVQLMGLGPANTTSLENNGAGGGRGGRDGGRGGNAAADPGGRGAQH